MGWWQELRGAGFLYPAFLAVLGAVAGSFASAAIYRMPRPELSLLRPLRSFCPACGRSLRWHDNLPVVGWLLLRGRCRDCGVRYGAGYLVHEVALAGLFVAAGWSWAGRASSPLPLLLCCLALTALWIAAAIDWAHLILPDEITLGGIPFGVLASLAVPAFQIWDPALERPPWGTGWLGLEPARQPILTAAASSGLGILLAGGGLLVLRAVFSRLLRQEALGLGDVKYLAAVGALLGVEGATWTLLVGVMAGAVLGLLNILRVTLVLWRRQRRRARRRGLGATLHSGWAIGRLIPFGPALVLGTILVLLAPAAVRHFFLESWPALLQALLQ